MGPRLPPAFLTLGAAVEALGRPPVLALTATATPQVLEDVVRLLSLEQPRTFNLGTYRANLQYRVEHTPSDIAKQQRLVQLVRATRGNRHPLRRDDRVLEAEGVTVA